MEYKSLCEEVEALLHRELKTRRDFEYLSDQIREKVHESLSANTLMRIWGYRPSVSPRFSSLDILARFVGYEDYNDFLVKHESQEVGNPGAENCDRNAAPTVTRKGRKWVWGVLALFVLLAAGVVYFCTLPHRETAKPVYLTTPDGISNNRQYFIHTRDRKRGSLGFASHQLATTYEKASCYQCDSASVFAFIQFEGSYYLYCVPQHRFINVLLAETDDPLRKAYADKNWCEFDIHQEEGYLVLDCWKDRSKGLVMTLNVNMYSGLILTDWGTMNGVLDDGNLFCFEDAGPFDPTEALAMLKKSKAKWE